MPDTRYRPFPTALSDAEWMALEPLLPAPSSIGRPLKWPRRLMAEAIFYLVRTDCAWRFLPHCFPPWPTACSQLRRWRCDGTLRAMHDRLRQLENVRYCRTAPRITSAVNCRPLRDRSCRTRAARRRLAMLRFAPGQCGAASPQRIHNSCRLTPSTERCVVVT